MFLDPHDPSPYKTEVIILEDLFFMFSAEYGTLI